MTAGRGALKCNPTNTSALLVPTLIKCWEFCWCYKGVILEATAVIVAAIIVVFLSCFSLSILFLLSAIFMRTFQRLYFIDFFPQPFRDLKLKLHMSSVDMRKL